jgi:transketolase
MGLNTDKPKRMRDAFIEEIYRKMHTDDRIFFLSDDLGAPILDKVRKEFDDRFINVGIAEQNLINVATGLGLEGYTVYAYGIAPFFFRAYEQIRINLALSAQMRKINVNMIGVGTGVSYDVSGPTHHCIEDIIAMRALPNIEVFSPCDWYCAEKFVDHTITSKQPKYIRLDGKLLPRVYDDHTQFHWDEGFNEIKKGDDICILSTGYPTQMSLKIIQQLKEKHKNIGLIDVFMIKPINEDALFNTIKNYKHLISIEEGFIDKGGFDTLLLTILNKKGSTIPLKRFGFKDEYLFKFGARDFLYKQHGFDEKNIIQTILNIEQKIPHKQIGGDT